MAVPAVAGVHDDHLAAARCKGLEAVEELIALVGLRGGSATKFRRRLMARPHNSSEPAEERRQLHGQSARKKIPKHVLNDSTAARQAVGSASTS